MVKTLQDSSELSRLNLEKLIEIAGSQAHLAKMLSTVCPNSPISPQAVKSWHVRGRISKRGAMIVSMCDELNTKITKEELRPDVPDFEWIGIKTNCDLDNL